MQSRRVLRERSSYRAENGIRGTFRFVGNLANGIYFGTTACPTCIVGRHYHWQRFKRADNEGGLQRSHEFDVSFELPAATVAIGGGRNAGLLAVQILGAGNAALREQIVRFKHKLAAESKAKNRKLQSEWSGGAET